MKPQFRCLSLLLITEDVLLYRSVQLTNERRPVDPSQEDLAVERHVSEYPNSGTPSKTSRPQSVRLLGVYYSVLSASTTGEARGSSGIRRFPMAEFFCGEYGRANKERWDPRLLVKLRRTGFSTSSAPPQRRRKFHATGLEISGRESSMSGKDFHRPR